MTTNPNYEFMQYFLDVIKEYATSNPDKDISRKFVYSNLIRFNIRNDQMKGKDISDMHPYWLSRYKDNQRIDVKDKVQGKFLWFFNGKVHGNELKMYIPMDYAHIKEGASQLFDFISSINIEHQSKIASIIRNDDVVVRINKMEDANRILEFINNNNYIKEGLIKINPFVPNYNGVGITMDNNYSFNETIANIISEFITKLRKNNGLHLTNVENLNKFIIKKAENITDLDLKDIYDLLGKTTSKNFIFQDFLNHYNNKQIDKYEARKRVTDPSIYFEQALIETSKKHPDFNFVDVIKAYLKGDNIGFTRGIKSRDAIDKYVKSGDLIPIMRQKLRENNIPIPQTDNELITKYLNLVLPKVNYFQMIQNAYINTLNAYDKLQAQEALRRLVLNNDVQYFTNKFNDRTLLKQNVLGKNIKRIILENIDLNNLDVNDINSIISRFEEFGVEKNIVK